MKGMVVVFFLAVSSVSLAGNNATSPETSIDVLRVYAGSIVVETTDGVLPNPAGCTFSNASKLIHIYRNSETEHIYATLLAAKLAGSVVSFGVKGSDCYPWGDGNIPTMYRVDVH